MLGRGWFSKLVFFLQAYEFSRKGIFSKGLFLSLLFFLIYLFIVEMGLARKREKATSCMK